MKQAVQYGHTRKPPGMPPWGFSIHIRPILDIYFLLLKSTFRYIKISGKPYKIKVFRLLSRMRHRGFEPRTT